MFGEIKQVTVLSVGDEQQSLHVAQLYPPQLLFHYKKTDTACERFKHFEAIGMEDKDSLVAVFTVVGNKTETPGRSGVITRVRPCYFFWGVVARWNNKMMRGTI